MTGVGCVKKGAPASGMRWHLQDTAAGMWCRVPSRFRTAARLLFHFVPACLGGHLTVAVLSGPVYPSRRRASMLVAGRRPWVDYLPRRFFSEAPRREFVCRVSAPSLAAVLHRLNPEVDLTVARLDRLSAGMIPDRDYLRVPEWVGARLQLPKDIRDLYRGSRNIREDLRRIRSRGLQPAISHHEPDFEHFYRDMYVPYIRARHGDTGAVHSLYLMRQWFRRGGVIFVEQKGKRVAGALFTRRKDTFYSCSVGTLGGREAPLRQGALAALWVFSNEHAAKTGCRRVEFGNSRSLLQDGVLRFKSKWGVRFYPTHTALFVLLLHWNRFNAAVEDFFTHSSPVFHDRGGLAGIHAAIGNQQSADAARKSLWINGIDRLYLICRNGWPPDVQPPPQTTLLAGDISPACFAGRREHRLGRLPAMRQPPEENG